ncbi:MAG: AEC family transporter [Spirochaetia bacterium]|nr:AEC family transporter [Spirochaetia bacterium]MCF7946138.1 AEC family transporter [Spirochaetia bacterium]
MSRVILSLVLLLLGLTLGYAIQKLVAAGRISLPIPIKKLRIRLQQTALLVMNPIAFLGAIWIAPIRDIRIAALPILGILALIVGGAAAWLISSILKLDNKKKGSFVVCGSFTNIGSIGALMVFLLLGEKAFSLVPFYKLFEQFIYYGVGFPVAKSLAGKSDGKQEKKIRKLVTDPYIIVSMVSIITGLMLNIVGVGRPEWYGPLNSLLIPIASVLLIISIGLALKFGRMKPYLNLGILIMGIKYLIIPLIITTSALILGLGKIEGGIPLKVVILLSTMPVGFIAIVPPTIYNLDVDLANTAWVMSTGGIMVTVPLLWYLFQII